MKEISVDHISIFDFKDFRDFLTKRGLPNGLYAHTSKNLVTWANRLGYKSPSSLSMVLKGQRLPSEEMIDKIARDFKMTSRESRYFKFLVEHEKKRNRGEDTLDVLERIKALTHERSAFSIDLKQFSTISEWYYMAIKQLIDTNHFVEDEEWIYRRLRKKVTPSQIRTAIQDLLDLDIISRDNNGQLFVVHHGLITSNDIPSSAIKRHHHGMLTQAMDAIFEQAVSERQVNSTTLKIKQEDIPEAKRTIYDFLKEFCERFGDDHKNGEVHQFNIQLFKLTQEVRDS